MRVLPVLGLALLATTSPSPMAAQQLSHAPQARPAAADSAAARIRGLVFQHDYEGALLAGREAAPAGRATPEARAWAISGMALYGMQEAAIAAADSLARGGAGGRWGDFAGAVARSTARDTTAVRLALRARAGKRWDPDLVWAHALALRGAGRSERALALLDSATARVPPSVQLLVLSADTRVRRDSASLVRARHLYDQAIRLDPGSEGAWLGKVLAAGGPGGSPAEGLEAARRAVAVAPLSTEAHQALWKELQGQANLSLERKQQEIGADVEALLRGRGRTPGALQAAAGVFKTLKLAARSDSLEAELRRDHPGSFEVEQLDMGAILSLDRSLEQGQAGDSVAARAELLRRLDRFVAETGHGDKALGQAYEILYLNLRRDRAAPPAQLAAALDGLARYGEPSIQWTMRVAVLQLAEYPESRAAAGRLARDIPRLNAAELSHVRTTGDTSAAVRRRFEADWTRRGQSMMHDALAWIALQDGRLDEAAAELALVPTTSRDAYVAFHSGALAERRGQAAEAEKAYLQGYAIERGMDEHPNEMALRRLAAQPGRPADYFERLVGAIREKDRARSKAWALRERIRNPKPVSPFTLTRLEGGTFSSEELKGRIAVINFWGIWCKPCVKELPQIRMLHDRYRLDGDVVILTIDNDPDPQIVRDFLKTRKLDIPVLLADTVVTRSLSGWPTTWFVDRQGRIAYIMSGARSGADEDVLEEFVWRLESLRSDTLSAKAAPAQKPDTALAPLRPRRVPGRGR